MKRNIKSFENKGIKIDNEMRKEQIHHKSAYKKIREIIKEHFPVFKKIKLPIMWLPDFLSLYEIMVIRKD